MFRLFEYFPRFFSFRQSQSRETYLMIQNLDESLKGILPTWADSLVEQRPLERVLVMRGVAKNLLGDKTTSKNKLKLFCYQQIRNFIPKFSVQPIRKRKTSKNLLMNLTY